MEAVAELAVGLDGEVFKRLTALAQARGISLDQLVGELLRAAVEELEQGE
jgi:predicted HicB family RNase H-like nuclease